MSYTLENSVFAKDGEPIARYDDETNTVRSPKYLPVRDSGPIRKLIAQLGKDKPKFALGALEKTTAPAKNGQSGEAGNKVPEAPPERDPAAGDKTPAYIVWMKKYHPAEYDTRYAGRIIPDISHLETLSPN